MQLHGTSWKSIVKILQLPSGQIRQNSIASMSIQVSFSDTANATFCHLLYILLVISFFQYGYDILLMLFYTTRRFCDMPYGEIRFHCSTYL